MAGTTNEKAFYTVLPCPPNTDHPVFPDSLSEIELCNKSPLAFVKFLLPPARLDVVAPASSQSIPFLYFVLSSRLCLVASLSACSFCDLCSFLYKP